MHFVGKDNHGSKHNCVLSEGGRWALAISVVAIATSYYQVGLANDLMLSQ